jgi:hypothetical protein
MKNPLFTRLAALCASVAITMVIVGSMAMLGHPEPETGAQLARAGTPQQ